MLKALITFIILFMINHQLQAQQLWLQPESFVLREGERLPISIKSGANFTGERWEFEKKDVKQIELHDGSSPIDLTDSLSVEGKNDLVMLVKNQGTLLFSMETHPALREIGGEVFDSYLKENGLDDALSLRKKSNGLSEPVQETLTYFTKLLIQSGNELDDNYKKLLGHTVEVVPEKQPYQLKVGDEVRFMILVRGKPVFGTRVKVWNRFENRTTIQNIYTEQNGTILVRISSPGPWMISFVTIESSKGGELQWTSHHASLVFGVQ